MSAVGFSKTIAISVIDFKLINKSSSDHERFMIGNIYKISEPPFEVDNYASFIISNSFMKQKFHF